MLISNIIMVVIMMMTMGKMQSRRVVRVGRKLLA